MNDRLAPSSAKSTSRREFLKESTAAVVAGSLAANLSLSSKVYAGGTETLRVGLIGCGGRGTGAAAQALNADPNVQLTAMGDTFSDRLEKSLVNLQSQPIADRVLVDADHRFVGFDAYKHVIDSVDVVLLTTPPHFRPEQFRYAVEKGKHCFVEKPVAVDAQGVKSVLETSRKAQEKNLSVVSGLCWRYDYGMRETFKRVHEGDIGDVVALQCSYNTRGLWMHKRQPEWSDMEWQVRNWLYFTWLSGDFITEQHIHSLDKGAWALHDAVPASASGTGGRQVRTSAEYGHCYDHFAVVFEYENGVKLFSRCRQQDGCDVDVSDHFFGTKGKADVFKHAIFDHNGKMMWRYSGKKNNMYQTEHDEFFASIRSANPINNGDYMAKSSMLAILGRMCAYTGKKITWEQAVASEERLGPDAYEWGPIEVAPVAMPGITPFV